jgi:hypothetical protein
LQGRVVLAILKNILSVGAQLAAPAYKDKNSFPSSCLIKLVPKLLLGNLISIAKLLLRYLKYFHPLLSTNNNCTHCPGGFQAFYHRLTADAGHAAGTGGGEVLVQMVSGRFPEDSLVEQFQERRVICSGPQCSFQVNLFVAEEAGAQAAVRSQAQPIALLAEMLAYGADKTDLAFGVTVAIALRRSGVDGRRQFLQRAIL